MANENIQGKCQKVQGVGEMKIENIQDWMNVWQVTCVELFVRKMLDCSSEFDWAVFSENPETCRRQYERDEWQNSRRDWGVHPQQHDLAEPSDPFETGESAAKG